jgi:hypothetical protein
MLLALIFLLLSQHVFASAACEGFYNYYMNLFQRENAHISDEYSLSRKIQNSRLKVIKEDVDMMRRYCVKFQDAFIRLEMLSEHSDKVLEGELVEPVLDCDYFLNEIAKNEIEIRKKQRKLDKLTGRLSRSESLESFVSGASPSKPFSPFSAVQKSPVGSLRSQKSLGSSGSLEEFLANKSIDFYQEQIKGIRRKNENLEKQWQVCFNDE